MYDVAKRKANRWLGDSSFKRGWASSNIRPNVNNGLNPFPWGSRRRGRGVF